MFKKCIISYFLFYSLGLFANNVSLQNAEVVSINKEDEQILINFDISWQNSFNLTSDAKNHDACWLFIKYRVNEAGEFSNWRHAKILSPTYEISKEAIVQFSGDKKGCFVYSKDKYENKDLYFSNLKIIWDYGIDNVNIDNPIEYKIFAIEMVYIPEGYFYLGDGKGGYGQFERETTGDPFLITSENELILGGGGSQSLGNNNNGNGDDDFDDKNQKFLPEAFPKGYKSFYIMKYEVTQGQYVEFLNTLTRNQQQNRIRTEISESSNSTSNYFVLSNSNQPKYRNGIRCDNNFIANKPIEFYCDLNNNNNKNELDDGQDIACNFVGYNDLAAYMDWAALRPLTELEFEKACRGPKLPIQGEFAWGSTSITPCTDVLHFGKNIEFPIPINSNAAGASMYEGGPVRVGSFGNGQIGRELNGASYYGVMELSGNLWEGTVTIGNSEGRNFEDINGDGLLDENGFSNVLTWPGTNAVGTGFKGGRFRPSGGGSSTSSLQVSNRKYASHYYEYYSYNDGFRGARTE